ncbi:Uma2 family endonuclease [Polyangium jinanense]|nr:Uma2 family endonuclease [Polyangium jinanense]
MGEAARKLVTLAEYLAAEETSDTKHEFLNGETFAMAGGTLEHARLQGNVYHELRNRLGDRRCSVFPSDARVRVEATGLSTYPDVSVVCGPLERHPEDKNSFVNPTVLVEVLSESTEAYDRGSKFHHYRQIPSLQEYVLVSSHRRHVEVFRRNPDGSWTLRDTKDKGAAELTSIGCKLSLDEVYRDVFEESA